MIVLDYQDRRPLYEQVSQKLRQMIEKGILARDQQLPSVRSLAMELSINPNTIQRAYALLEKEGYILSGEGERKFCLSKGKFHGGEKGGILRELHELLVEGFDMGVTRRQVCEQIDSVYKEGSR